MLRITSAAVMLLLFGSAATWAADGAAVYKTHCASCHGADGKADTPVAKAMKVPALAGDANVQKMSANDIAQRIKDNPKHPGAVKSLSGDDISAASAFVKQMAGGE
jgi:cytochrome c553